MKRQLSGLPKAKTVVLSRQDRISQFPSILRFITEPQFAVGYFRYLKVFSVSFVSGFLLIVTLFQLSILSHNLQLVQSLQAQRQIITKEITYWQQMGSRYQNYRDVYFRLATLEYQLGNMSQAQYYVQKALRLDPNFQQGQVLGAQIRSTSQ